MLKEKGIGKQVERERRDGKTKGKKMEKKGKEEEVRREGRRML